MSMPPIAALIAHRVADFDAWKKVFDDVVDMRREASVLGHDVARGIDDPDMVYVFCPAGDPEAFLAHVQSDELKSAMQQAGVVSQPVVLVLKPVHESFEMVFNGPALVVHHPVEDYDAWRQVYDEADDMRKGFGVVGDAINQGWDNPNQVVVYNQCQDLDQMRSMTDSDELKAAMQRAGVSGPPEIHFIQSVDVAEY